MHMYFKGRGWWCIQASFLVLTHASSVRQRTSLEAPYDTKCRKGGLKYFEGYSIGACRMECLTDDTMDKCGCIAPFMPGEPPW